MDEIHLETIFVHELAHLLASGHGSDFYNVLLQWMPDYKQRHRALVAAHRKIEG
jgi:predicted metal-dependent hydrolase